MSEEYARATCAFAIRLDAIIGKRLIPTRQKEIALLGARDNKEKPVLNGDLANQNACTRRISVRPLGSLWLCAERPLVKTHTENTEVAQRNWR
jgi:hypothetical protein